MKLIIDIKDNKASYLLALLNDLSYVRVKEISSEKADFITGLKSATDEVRLAKQGKIKLKSARDLLNEL